MFSSTGAFQLNDTELHNKVVDIQKQIDCLSACQAELLADWDARKLWNSDGSRSSSGRYARETGCAPSTAKHLIKRAKRLQDMPVVAEAFANGLSADRVDLLTRANKPEVHGLFERDESELLSMATQLCFDDARRAVDYWSQLADEAGAELRGKNEVEKRSASAVRTFEGTVDVRALLDPVSGEIFLNEFERLERELFESDWSEAKAIHGSDVLVSHLGRTATQRRADVLVLMAERSASATGGSNRPLLTVLVGEKTLDRICELASGTVIAPGQVVPLLSKTQIERIVFDGKSRVIDVSHKRLFVGALRRAIEVRDRHCQHQSVCDVRADKCDIDHGVAASRGGRTSQTNGRLMCGPHNRAKGSGPP